MAIVPQAFVNQTELLKRIKRFQKHFAKDPDVAVIEHRFGEDWSGDDSVFFDVFLATSNPPAEVIRRLSAELTTQLLQVVRSEELGLYSYLNLISRPKNG
jgi:hypothetical protein